MKFIHKVRLSCYSQLVYTDIFPICIDSLILSLLFRELTHPCSQQYWPMRGTYYMTCSRQSRSPPTTCVLGLMTALSPLLTV